MIETLQERLTGRFLLEDFVDEKTGELIMPKDKMRTMQLKSRLSLTPVPMKQTEE